MVVIIVILLTSLKISTTHGSSECNPSTCGDQYIGHPFTLKGGPSNCIGDEKYQLSCIGNKTFMAAPYDKYLVTNIFYDNDTINIVHTGFLSGKCNLPSSQPITYSFLPDGFSSVDGMQWVTFVNCSKKIDSDSHEAVHCLSQNNRFIYVTETNNIMYLSPSCTYLTMVAITNETEIFNFGNDVFRALKDGGGDIFGIMKHGFSISWAPQKIKRSKIIRRCLREAYHRQGSYYTVGGRLTMIERSDHLDLLQLEFEFLACIRDQTKDIALYRCSSALVAFLDIIILYLVLISLGRLIAPLVIHIFLLYELLKMLSPIDYIENFLRNQHRTTLTRYAYSDIVAMTKHFKDQLGQGGFGTVYKGELPADYLVAVKLLGKSNDNGEDFINEVSTIGTIHHTNVVRLIGFCSEGLHRALVYEYMHNGSLDKYNFSSTQKFTTNKLNEIALGVARGIDYLHQGCDMRILHFDIKPHNILLDSNFNPKVSDFGLAKLYSKDKSLVSTFAARGTIGYMAPELISRSFGLVSYKSDVYSFGMLLLEMAGGRRNYNSRVENSSQAYYPSWVYDRLNPNNSNLEVLDQKVEIGDIERMLCKVGLWCIQISPSSRPTMSRVIEMLEGEVDDVEMPPKPFFFSSSQSATRVQKSFETSFNEISTIYESE